uniref:G_PROTEIN_RECEP_F1_2 domain-containing protein n=1 Tax=Haemonchus contortus TaxID=6289 RepID=A0A7I4YZK2_HAECO
MRDSSGYVGILLLICYDICIFSHLVISINRMSAIYFPIKYYIHFSNRNTTIIIVIIWTLAILLPILLRRGSICSFHYSDAIYTFIFSSNEECGWLRYFDFSQDVSIVTLIAIIDTTSVIKYRLTSIQVKGFQVAKAIRLVTASKRKADMNLLKQTVAQGVVFAVELSTYFFFGWLFQNKWAVWSLTTLAWNVVHLSDAIIIITLNKEFRRFLCTILPWNSCAQKSRKYNGRVHPSATAGIATIPRGSFPKQNQQSNSELFEHAH